MISNPAPDPKKSHNSAGSDSKNPDQEQHCKRCWQCFLWYVFYRQCLFCHQDGSSKRLCRKEV